MGSQLEGNRALALGFEAEALVGRSSSSSLLLALSSAAGRLAVTSFKLAKMRSKLTMPVVQSRREWAFSA